MRRGSRARWAPIALLALAGCIPHPHGRAPTRPGTAPRHGAAPRPKPASAVAPRSTLQSPAQYRMCLADLARLGIQYEPLPDRDFRNGCSALQSVKLVAIGTPVTNLGAVRCPLARAFALWVRDVVQPAGQRFFAQDVRKLESFGSFACRPVNNVSGGKLSEHGLANAMDIAAFVLADGRRITVKDGWNGEDAQARGFLRAVHDAACRRFSVVLGPDANAYHRDHLHFDMAAGAYCR